MSQSESVNGVQPGHHSSQLQAFIHEHRQQRPVLLMTHVVYGFPTVDDSLQLMETLLQAGVELLEIQFPFSDPIADGPSIVSACHRAIENNPQLRHCLESINDLSRRYPDSRILLMSYLNPLYRYGLSKLVGDAAPGCSGLIIPDLPMEQAATYRSDCRSAGIDPIWLLTPDTPPARRRQLCAIASGMLYCVSRRGVTGTGKPVACDETDEPQRLQRYLSAVAADSTLPLAVGFGIRTPRQVQQLRGYADIAVVGSAVLDAFRDGGLTAVSDLIDRLRKSP